MKAQPCLPQDILEVNKSKEYTLIATDLLESVLTDPNLNAQTTKLWQILFNLARYNANFEIKVSYSYLAKKLGKSARTISRYIESLQNTGYIIIKHNFDKRGAQRPSTLSVRVPQLSIDQARNKKNRSTKNYSATNESLIKNNIERPEFTEDTISIANSCAISQEPAELKNVIRETFQGHSDIQENHHNTPDINSADHGLLNQTQENLDNPSYSLLAKTDRGEYDTSVIQKDIIEKEINNNNNSVVSFLQEKEQVTILKDKIEHLEQQLVKGNQQQTDITDHSLLYDQIKKNSQIEAALHLARIALEKAQRTIQDQTKQQTTKSELTNNLNLMLEKTGERRLSTFTFKRLIKSLMTYGYSGNTLNMLVNEIVFEARFGSLINCNKTKNTLSLDKAINIGLKLVREKRWCTPALLEN
jgi:hypothetical protein